MQLWSRIRGDWELKESLLRYWAGDEAWDDANEALTDGCDVSVLKYYVFYCDAIPKDERILQNFSTPTAFSSSAIQEYRLITLRERML